MSRVGNFSSSEIYRLMSKGRGNWSIDNTGKAFESYVKEKAFERKLGRPLQNKVNAKPTTWGTLVEEQCFNRLDLKYSLVSKDRYYHNDFSEYWSGMPDLITPELVGDIKSPYTLTSFMELLEAMTDAENLKKAKPQYYWQLVSNAILCDRDIAVLVVYVPYKRDLAKIRELAQEKIDSSNTYAWINWADDEELPYIPDDAELLDANSFEFKVSDKDKQMLNDRVELAINELNKQL